MLGIMYDVCLSIVVYNGDLAGAVRFGSVFPFERSDVFNRSRPSGGKTSVVKR